MSEERPQSGEERREAEQPAGGSPASGEGSSGENTCPQCGGSGHIENDVTCPQCGGTGVVRAVGGG